MYDGWNLLAELNATNSSVISGFLWGLDLRGSIQGSGGVGGLLAVATSGKGLDFFIYDANGNVAGLATASNGTISGQYEYQPFGGILRITGTSAAANRFRFSTTYTDAESDFAYYGFRYYNAQTGRWLNRDPLTEQGGLNLYASVGNSPLTRVDYLGLRDDPGPGGPPCFPGCPICSPPPAPPNGNQGYNDIPYWFDHPADEGKHCCCEPAATLTRFGRIDNPPTRTQLSMKIDIQLDGCYEDLAIIWWTCWRPDGSAGVMPGFNNQTSASLDVYGITLPVIGDLSTGPHITETRIRYLSCENKRWVKHVRTAGRTYIWGNGQWTGTNGGTW